MLSRLSTGTMNPPVGKSGPCRILSSSAVVMSGLSMTATTASIASPMLCGGMFVARPTAMPLAPLTSRLGKRPGSILGSSMLSSKLGLHVTVSLSRSRRSSSARGLILASVYLIAAGGSPSTEPKLPCPSTSFMRMENGCAILTIAPYTELSPWGWYLPRQSPTMRADFL